MIRLAVVLTFALLQLQATSAFYIDFNDGYFQEQEINIINRPFLNPYNPTQILPLPSKHLPRHHLNKTPTPPNGIPPLPPTPPQWPFPPMQGSAPLPVPTTPPSPPPKPQPTPSPPLPQPEQKPETVPPQPKPEPEPKIPIPNPTPSSQKPSNPQLIPKPKVSSPNPPKNETSPPIPPLEPKTVKPDEQPPPPPQTTNNVHQPTQVLDTETKPNPQVSIEKNPFIPHLLPLKSPFGTIEQSTNQKSTIAVPSSLQPVAKPCNGVCIPGPIEPHHLAGLKNFKPNIPVALRPPKPLPCNGLCVPFESDHTSASEKVPEIQTSGLEDRPISVPNVSAHESSPKANQSVHPKAETKPALNDLHPVPKIKVSAAPKNSIAKVTLKKPLKRLISSRRAQKSSRRNSPTKVISLLHVIAPSRLRPLSNIPHPNLLKLAPILEEAEPADFDHRKSKLHILSQRAPSRVFAAREVTPKQIPKIVHKSIVPVANIHLPKSSIGVQNFIKHESRQQRSKIRPAINLPKSIAHSSTIKVGKKKIGDSKINNTKQSNLLKQNTNSTLNQSRPMNGFLLQQDINPQQIVSRTAQSSVKKVLQNVASHLPIDATPNQTQQVHTKQNNSQQYMHQQNQQRHASALQNPFQGKPFFPLQPPQQETQNQNIPNHGSVNLVDLHQKNPQQKTDLQPLLGAQSLNAIKQQNTSQRLLHEGTKQQSYPLLPIHQLLTPEFKPQQQPPQRIPIPPQIIPSQQIPAQQLPPQQLPKTVKPQQQLPLQQPPYQHPPPQQPSPRQPTPTQPSPQQLSPQQPPPQQPPPQQPHQLQPPPQQPPQLQPPPQQPPQLQPPPQQPPPQQLHPQQPPQLQPPPQQPPQLQPPPQQPPPQQPPPQQLHPQQPPPQQPLVQHPPPQQTPPQQAPPQKPPPQQPSPQQLTPTQPPQQQQQHQQPSKQSPLQQPPLPQQPSTPKLPLQQPHQQQQPPQQQPRSPQLHPQNSSLQQPPQQFAAQQYKPQQLSPQQPPSRQLPPPSQGAQQKASLQQKPPQPNPPPPFRLQQNLLQQGSLHPNVPQQLPAQQNIPKQYLHPQEQPQLFTPQQNPLIQGQQRSFSPQINHMQQGSVQPITLQGQGLPKQVNPSQSNLLKHITSNQDQARQPNPQQQSPPFARFPPRGIPQLHFSPQRYQPQIRPSLGNLQPYTPPELNTNQANERPHDGYPLERTVQQNRPFGSFHPNPNFIPISQQGRPQFNVLPQHPSIFNAQPNQIQYNTNNKPIQQIIPAQNNNILPQRNYPNPQFNNYPYPQNPYPNNNIPTHYNPHMLSYAPQPPNNPLPLPQFIKTTGINQQNGPIFTKPNFTLPTKNLTQPN